jgi:hypothetical protein
MVKLAVTEQEGDPEEMVQVYVPAHNPVALAVPCPPPGAGAQV